VPAFVAPMIMFSGILYERNTVPVWLGWLQNLSLVNYSFSALMIQQIHILPASLAGLVLDFTQVNMDDLYWDIAMLWIMNFALQFGTWVNLTTRLRFTAAN
jgi:ABC-type multidrug transport system permease subunit